MKTIYKMGLILALLLSFTISTSDTRADLSTEIQRGEYRYAVTVYDSQVFAMKEKGLGLTRILDLLAIKSMECNKYDGLCYGINNSDVGPFQINRVHKEQYNTSWKMMQNKALPELFSYQLSYANNLVDSYMDRFCGAEEHRAVGKTYNNYNRWTCIAKSYNGHPRYKYTYATLGWAKREKIKEYIMSNFDINNF